MDRKKTIYSLSFMIMLIDQVIKLIVIKNLKINEQIVLIKNFFSIYYVKNTGAAFSILGNQRTLLIIISCICLIIIKEYIKKTDINDKLSLISLGLILGGILGNLFDRIVYKGVIDYLSFIIINYSFPVFNLADIAITMGTFLLIINYFIENKKQM